MPILAAEPAVFPLNLFSICNSATEDARWWALHTRPRAEKALARRLFKKQISFFLPVHEQNRNAQRRTQACLPLFPGYLFLRGPREALHSALDTRLVANSLAVADQDQLTANLRDIHRLIESGGPLSREFHPLPGTRVRISRGPLTGIEGNVTRTGKSLKFVVQVQFLQSGAAVEVDASMVEPV